MLQLEVLLLLRIPRLWVGDGGPLTDEQFHYVSRVLRLRDGNKVRIFGTDGEFEGVLEKRDVRDLKLLRRPEKEVPLELYFAPLRRKRSTMLVEKAVELGATALVGVRTEFTQGPMPKQATAIEAAQQCERLSVPRIEGPITLRDITADPLFVCLERSNEPHLFQVAPADGPCAVLVGPEAGFSDKDLSELPSHATPVSLGPSILRAETAAMVAVSFVATKRHL